MEFLITFTILVLVPFTFSQNTIDTTGTLAGNLIKPIKNNGNTIKPVKNNVNNVYNVYVEQHHHFHTDEEKEEDQNEVERHAMAGQVQTGCMNGKEPRVSKILNILRTSHINNPLALALAHKFLN